MVFTRKVNCWFCNHETRVSFFKTNSWTCESCSQYNGFNRHGDYNKPIVPSETVTNVKFCTSAAPANCETRVVLCDRCNRYQELKVQELNKFEPKNEKNFDAEFEDYKNRLEAIYDLCINCKNKLKVHLSHLDREIGRHNSNAEVPQQQQQQKRMSILKRFNDVKNELCNGYSQIKNGYTKTAFIEKPTNNGDSDNKKLFSNKANTIAGTVPPYAFSNHHHVTVANTKKDKLTKKVSVNQEKTPMKPQEKPSTKFYHIIIADILIFVCVLSVFLSDLTNLLNDSGNIRMDNTNKLVIVYFYANYILNSCIAISSFVFVLRPKLSRLCITTGILVCSLIHAQIINMRHIEEHYVLELLSSFVLTTFLLIARLYNLIQALAYIKNKTINKANTSLLNQSSLNQSSLNDTINQESSDGHLMLPVEQLSKKTIVDNRATFHKSASAQLLVNNTTPHNYKTRLSQKNAAESPNIEDSPMQVDTSQNENDCSGRPPQISSKMKANLFASHVVKQPLAIHNN